MLPRNVRQGRLMVCPADLPGSAALWTVWERLDEGAVAHVRYAGLLVAVEGETPAELFDRAREKAQEER